MDTVKIFSLDRNRKAEGKSDRGNEIIEDIRNICKMLDSAYERFQYEQDEDLVDATIYEMEALKARYRYLIRKAKASNIANLELTAFWDANGRVD
ncbi:MAG: DUF2508 family protein [Clostridiales bacterium]|jgi:TusA-related sulfurtransferase|nr:DUF2508 family protein [Clostridiales bacterium]